MPVGTSTLVNNVIFFGAVMTALLILSWVLARQVGRGLRLGLRALRLAASPAALRACERIERQAARIIVLTAALASIGLVLGAVVTTWYDIDAAPRTWEWARVVVLSDPIGLLWRAGEVVAAVVVGVYAHRLLQAIVGLGIGALKRHPAFVGGAVQLDLLHLRLASLLRWGALLGVAAAALTLAGLPAIVVEPTRAATSIVVGALLARTLVVIAGLGVDVAVQLVRAIDGGPSPLRYIGRFERLEHLAKVTKRTVEYFCFVGAATWIFSHVEVGGWLAEAGFMVIRLIALIYVGRVVIEICGLVLREFLLADPEGRPEGEYKQRMTLVPVGTSVVRYIVYFCVLIMGLEEIGVDTAPILAGAGLLGLAVGLGAQTLVSDVVSGFFILFEGLFLVGDRIRVGEVIGEVEEIGVRILKIRDELGVLHCIPNGEVREVASHASCWVNAAVEFVVPYDEPLPALLERLGEAMARVRPCYDDIVGDTEFVVQELLEVGVLVRALTRVKPGRDDAVAESLRSELLVALVAAGVRPQACHAVLVRAAAGSAD
ncbi:MAG: mechanosensitive ion channel [Nannocystaceae bacterium]